MTDLIIHPEINDFNATSVRICPGSKRGRSMIGGKAARSAIVRKSGIGNFLQMMTEADISFTIAESETVWQIAEARFAKED